mmetsp:Transcript_7624/g.20238  ORF Transcript_7624/g.20238 Transcript_7624/m.20238 type:complete len:235 (+) Transcript_7624:90-794(+)
MGLFGKKKDEKPAAAAAAAPVVRPAAASRPAPSLDETVFNMKFTAKQLERMSKKSDKDIAKEKLKCKEAIQKGNADGARVYAENAIRHEKQALSYLKLASRLDAVASKMEGQMKMQQVMGQMSDVTASLGVALQSMDVEKIARTMDTFERQFEDLDLQGKYMDGAIAETTAMSTPQNEVDLLLQKVGDEHELDVKEMLSGGRVKDRPVQNGPQSNADSAQTDDLEARFAALRNQ